jgi:hypothetical protein
MARAGIPHPRLPFGVSQRRWALHAAVLLTAFAAVLYAALAGDGEDDRPPAARPPPLIGANPAAAPPALTPFAGPSPSPTPEPSPPPSPSPEPSPSPTAAPSDAPEPSPLPSPQPAPTPSPAPPPTSPEAPRSPPAAIVTPRPAVTARAVTTAALRVSPSQEAIISGYLPAGSTVTVTGCSAACAWLQVVTPSGTLWSARYFWTVTGDLSIYGGR